MNIPKTAVTIQTPLLKWIKGVTSPYPTVVRLIIAVQIPLDKWFNLLSGTVLSNTLISNPQTRIAVTNTAVTAANGKFLIKYLIENLMLDSTLVIF